MCSRNIFITIIAGLLLASCSSTRYISIETYNPANITFPENVQSILIVNNAAAQQDVPFLSDMRRLPDSIYIAADSATADFCRILGMNIAESPYFDDVRLYEGCLREDRMAFSEQPLSVGEVTQLCEDHGVDAIISLDRMVFRIKESGEKLLGAILTEDVRTEVSGVVRAYLPDRRKPLSAVYMSDTLSLFTNMDDYGYGESLFFEPEAMLREAAIRMANGAYVNFVPYWSEDTRWYFVAANSHWKEAAAYAAAEKWEQAARIWESLYASAMSWKDKGRLASNLALAAELTGDLPTALQWATLANQYFAEHLNVGDNTVKRQSQYVEVLQQRVEGEKILNIQTGTRVN